MNPYEQELFRAVMAKFAPDIREALHTAEGFNLSSPRLPSINLPLRADASVIYQNDMGAFSVRGRFLNHDKKEWLQAESFFSTRELVGGRDTSVVCEYLFDELKKKFIREFVGSDLEKAIKTRGRA